MDTTEFIIFLASIFFSFLFISKLYVSISKAWPPERGKQAKSVLGILPVISFMIILFTLMVLASFDVVGSFFYKLFYILLGYACIYGGLTLMACFFDLSWTYDVINLNNKAALFAVSGGFLGLTVIYSGANIGDGPGWWCVIFAGGLGFTAWFILALIINKLTNVFERITIERDTKCGLRFGFYLLASGVILGWASSGDWTSFYMTLVEFAVGWPVLPLAALIVAIERHYIFS